MNRKLKGIAWAVVAVVAGAGVWWFATGKSAAQDKADGAATAASAASGPVKPALSVAVTRPLSARWSTTVKGTGSLAPWQEAVIGAELAGLRLTEVRVNVGDVVRRGQTLATLQQDAVQADLNSSQAAWREAQAAFHEAQLNAQRARALQSSDAVSAQEAQRAFTAEQTAQARMDAAKARLATDELRLRHTVITAPDDGVISARLATLGAVVQPGQELFRLIRQQRLEWRAEVPAADLAKIRPGMPVQLTTVVGKQVEGRVRMVAPTVDTSTRNGTVYVDVPVAQAGQAGARAGMFATGQFEVGQSEGLTLPQSAVLLRDGFSHVFVVQPDRRVTDVKVQVGRRVGDRIEVLKGVSPQAEVVASGGGFLADGDTVHVLKGQP